jgi:predicted alpha/beta-hydrolase family hydrolase
VPDVTEIVTAAGPAEVVLGQPAGRPPRFLVVLTHGAGGTPDTADVLAVRDAVQALGAVTALVTQPYRVRGGRAPGPAAKQDAAWAEVVGVLRRETARDGRPLPLVQCGRSNGARVACRTASRVGAAGVVALAFPLHPPGQPDKSRDGELRAAGAAVLVVNGERDPFGVPGPDDSTTVVALPGEAHALSRHPAAVADAVTAWLLSAEEGVARTPGVASAAGEPSGEPGPPIPRLGI